MCTIRVRCSSSSSSNQYVSNYLIMNPNPNFSPFFSFSFSVTSIDPISTTNFMRFEEQKKRTSIQLIIIIKCALWRLGKSITKCWCWEFSIQSHVCVNLSTLLDKHKNDYAIALFQCAVTQSCECKDMNGSWMVLSVICNKNSFFWFNGKVIRTGGRQKLQNDTRTKENQYQNINSKKKNEKQMPMNHWNERKWKKKRKKSRM